MAKVLGVGGVFLKVADPAAVRDWYRRILGFEFEAWGGAIFQAIEGGQTVWSPFEASTDYFAPSDQPVMINFSVDDIDGILERAAEAGVTPIGRNDSDPYGRFAWLLDPMGFKIELWQAAPSVNEADEGGS